MHSLMIDLETLDTLPGAAIISVGFVAFNPETGWIDNKGGMEIYPDVEEQFAEGRTVSWSTIAWWLDQSDAARKRVARPPKLRVKKAEIKASVMDYWTRMNCKYVWGNGSIFDIAILENWWGHVQIPWKYYNIRDTRTLWHVSPVEKDGLTAHSALEDATAQAQRVVASWGKARAVVEVYAMSRLRAVLDQINDIEATIARIEAEAKDTSSFAYRMTLKSLENRREVFREELADVTRLEAAETAPHETRQI